MALEYAKGELIMKRKFLAMLLSSAMLATMLVGCGNEPTTTQEPPKETTQDVAEETTTQEETQDVEEEPTQEETQDVEETTSQEPTQDEFGEFIVSHRFDGGYVDEYQNPDNEEMSDYDVYLDINGDEMYFTFTSGKGFGEVVQSSDNQMLLFPENQETCLIAWYGGKLEGEDSYMRNLSKEVLSGLVAAATPDMSTYQVDETDTYYCVTFEFVYSNGLPGYACFIDNYETNECYQFAYCENEKIYDSDRALNVIKSIKTSETNFHPIQ